MAGQPGRKIRGGINDNYTWKLMAFLWLFVAFLWLANAAIEYFAGGEVSAKFLLLGVTSVLLAWVSWRKSRGVGRMTFNPEPKGATETTRGA